MACSLLYVAYPMRLDLRAANAIQTYDTVKELRKLIDDMRLVLPRWPGVASAFDGLEPIYLLRPAFNKLSRFVPWAGWSYMERTVFSSMLVVILSMWRLAGKRVSVIYVRDAVCAAWLARSVRLHGARVIYEVHDLESAHPSLASKWPAKFWSRALRWVDGNALQRASCVVSLTSTFKNWMVKQGIRRAESVHVVPDAFNPDLLPEFPNEAVRELLGLEPDSYIIGYAGLTFAYRRLDLLVEAFALLMNALPNAFLLLVGGRTQEINDLRAQAVDLNIPETRYLFTGQVEHALAARYVAASDVVVVPDTVTSMTASPLKLFEYMAAAKPIVCKDMPALREILDESCALFFKGDDAEDLARSLKALALAPAVALKLGRTAGLRSERYTYTARAVAIAEVIERCR